MKTASGERGSISCMEGMRRRTQPDVCASASVSRCELRSTHFRIVHCLRLSDAEIGDNLLSLMFAGHDTTSSALTTTLYCLQKNPEVGHGGGRCTGSTHMQNSPEATPYVLAVAILTIVPAVPV